MEIKRNGSQASSKGSSNWFTGNVRVDPLFDAPAPARVFGAYVTFEPGARTAWHAHALGQTLIVTAGCGRVQRWRGPVEEIQPGDVVWMMNKRNKSWFLLNSNNETNKIIECQINTVSKSNLIFTHTLTIGSHHQPCYFTTDNRKETSS